MNRAGKTGGNEWGRMGASKVSERKVESKSEVLFSRRKTDPNINVHHYKLTLLLVGSLLLWFLQLYILFSLAREMAGCESRWNNVEFKICCALHTIKIQNTNYAPKQTNEQTSQRTC